MEINCEYDIVSIGDFCREYNISEERRRKMSLFNENVISIDQQEFNRIKEGAKYSDYSGEYSWIQKRKHELGVSISENNKRPRLDSILKPVQLPLHHLDDLEGETYQHIILSSELNSNYTTSGNRAFPRDETLQSDDTFQAIESDIINNLTNDYIILNSDDIENRSSPLYFF